MMRWVLIAVVVVVLAALAWWTSGRTPGSTSSGFDRARRESDVLRDHGPTNIPTDPGGF
jgi:hypothetical protein